MKHRDIREQHHIANNMIKYGEPFHVQLGYAIKIGNDVQRRKIGNAFMKDFTKFENM